MTEFIKVNMKQNQLSPNRYKLVSGNSNGAPLCPYGNHFEWVGYDIMLDEYVRFTNSVFKLLVREN